jgi:hypothetical protein
MLLQPAPLKNDLTSSNVLTQPWYIWFRNLSQNLVESCTVKQGNDSNYFYTTNENNLTIIYNGPGGISLTLPYSAALDQILPYFLQDSSGNWNYTFVNLSKNDSEIVLPNSNIKINHQIIIQQVNR